MTCSSCSQLAADVKLNHANFQQKDLRYFYLSLTHFFFFFFPSRKQCGKFSLRLCSDIFLTQTSQGDTQGYRQ